MPVLLISVTQQQLVLGRPQRCSARLYSFQTSECTSLALSHQARRAEDGALKDSSEKKKEKKKEQANLAYSTFSRDQGRVYVRLVESQVPPPHIQTSLFRFFFFFLNKGSCETEDWSNDC